MRVAFTHERGMNEWFLWKRTRTNAWIRHKSKFLKFSCFAFTLRKILSAILNNSLSFVFLFLFCFLECFIFLLTYTSTTVPRPLCSSLCSGTKEGPREGRKGNDRLHQRPTLLDICPHMWTVNKQPISDKQRNTRLSAWMNILKYYWISQSKLRSRKRSWISNNVGIFSGALFSSSPLPPSFASLWKL